MLTERILPTDSTDQCPPQIKEGLAQPIPQLNPVRLWGRDHSVHGLD
jgi:hypothetical protein